MRILGLDYGSKTVGVAISDQMLITAQGLEIIRRESEGKIRKTYQRIEQICKEYGVEKIVLGNPKNMDGTDGQRVKKTVEFKENLERRTSLPVILWDERLTSVSAHNVMNETGVKKNREKDYVDQIAAMIILQNYLESIR